MKDYPGHDPENEDLGSELQITANSIMPVQNLIQNRSL